jgi:Peptidase family S41
MKNIKQILLTVCITYCLLPAATQAAPHAGELPYKQTALYIQVWGLAKYRAVNEPGGDKADQLFLSHTRLLEASGSTTAAWRKILNELFGNELPLLTNPAAVSFAELEKMLAGQNLLLPDCRYHSPNIKYPMLDRNFIDKFDERNMPEDFNPHSSLLLLAKYWNIIEYFFPYKSSTPLPWQEVLHKYIPVFYKANSLDAARLGMLQLIAEIRDGHASWPASLTDVSAFKKNQYLFSYDGIIIKDSTYFLPTDPADYLFNDKAIRITTINGQPVNRYIDSAAQFISYSSHYSKLREVKVDLVWDSLPSAFTVTCSDGSTHELKRNLTFSSPELYNRIDFLQNDSILYINFNKLKSRKQLGSVLNNDTRDKLKYVFVDLRHGPGSYQSMMLGKLLGTDKAESISRYGALRCNDSMNYAVNKTNYAKGDATPYFAGRVIVLVNEITQSSTETTCMTLQTNPNTIVMGTPTAGANGAVVYVNLPFGIRTQFTNVYFTYPDGRNYQRKGILPDIRADIYSIKTIGDLITVIHKFHLHE